MKEGTKVLVYSKYEGTVIQVLDNSTCLVRFKQYFVDCFKIDDLQKIE